jgi:hypothetical protein
MWLEFYRCMLCSTEETIEREDDWDFETSSVECSNCEWYMDRTGDNWGQLEDELFADFPEDLWVDPMEEEIIYE